MANKAFLCCPMPCAVKLNKEIKEIVAREQVLRDEIDKIIEEASL